MPSVRQLTWVEANEAHEAALNRFVCTNPAKAIWEPYRGKHHPAPWELEVQSGLRGLHLPVSRGELLELCLDEVGEVCAAVRVAFGDDSDQLLVLAVAVSVDHRGTGLGRAALEEGLSILSATREEFDLDCGIWARIHPENVRSQHLFRAAGFEYIDDREGLQMWVLY